MIIEIRCSACNTKLRVGDKFFGREIPCPACQEPLSVPTPEEEATEAAASKPAEKKSSVPYRGRRKKAARRSSVATAPPPPPPRVEAEEEPVFATAASPVSSFSSVQQRKKSNNVGIFLGIAAVAGLLLGGFFLYQASSNPEKVANKDSKPETAEEKDDFVLPPPGAGKKAQEQEEEQGLGFSNPLAEKQPIAGLKPPPQPAPKTSPAETTPPVKIPGEPRQDPIASIVPQALDPKEREPKPLPQKTPTVGTPPLKEAPSENEPKDPANTSIAEASGPPTPTEPAETTPGEGRSSSDGGKLSLNPTQADVERELLPIKPFKPYICVEGEPEPDPANAVHAMLSRESVKAGYDPQVLIEEAKQRLAKARQKHLAWEQKLGFQLLRVETHFATIHSQLPAARTRQIAAAIETMGSGLQDGSKSLELTVSRPDTFDLIILKDEKTYLAFLQKMKADWQPGFGDEWALLKEVNSVSVPGTAVFYYRPAPAPPPEHSAIYQTAGEQIRQITKGNSPHWLRIGFSAVCEYAVLGQNRVQAVDYQKTDLPLTPDWGQALIRLAQASRLRPWRDLFISSVQDWEVTDHVSAFGVVGFLMKSNPYQFRQFLKQIANETDEFTALKDTYGKLVPALQQDWVQWIRRGG